MAFVQYFLKVLKRVPRADIYISWENFSLSLFLLIYNFGNLGFHHLQALSDIAVPSAPTPSSHTEYTAYPRYITNGNCCGAASNPKA